MRAIDADELLKVTVKRNGIWNAITNSSGEGLEEIINNQPTIEIPKWIPVIERLPEKNVEVLVTTDLGYVTIAEWFEYDHWFICEGSYNADTDELTAWMPLPEPYKEEETHENKFPKGTRMGAGLRDSKGDKDEV